MSTPRRPTRARSQFSSLLRSYLDHLDATAASRTGSNTRRLSLLDEVTGIKNGQTAIRVLADAGRLRGASSWAATLATLADSTSMGKLAEAVVADHLRRLSGPRTYYFRTRDGEEIDFAT